MEEGCHLLDSDGEPWGLQIEVQVEGAFEETRLRDAIGVALDRHPMARARLQGVDERGHRLEWEIPELVDLDPLLVVSCPDAASLSATRAAFHSRPLHLSISPPLRVLLARSPGGDILMLNVNHAVADGLGALRLMRSIARAYARDPDPLPYVDPLGVRQELEQRLRQAGAATQVRRSLVIGAKLLDLLQPPEHPGSDNEEKGYGFETLEMNVEQTAALRVPNRSLTVNDVLLCALHLAISRWIEHTVGRCDLVRVLMGMNLRPREWCQEVVGNLSIMSTTSTTPFDRRTTLGALEVVNSQTRRLKRDGTGAALIEILGRACELPVWSKRALARTFDDAGGRLVDTALLSNLGRIESPSFGDAGRTAGVWYSGPTKRPLGISVGAVSPDNRLHLVFRYHRSLFTPSSARNLIACFRHSLDDLGHSLERLGNPQRLAAPVSGDAPL